MDTPRAFQERTEVGTLFPTRLHGEASTAPPAGFQAEFAGL